MDYISNISPFSVFSNSDNGVKDNLGTVIVNFTVFSVMNGTLMLTEIAPSACPRS